MCQSFFARWCKVRSTSVSILATAIFLASALIMQSNSALAQSTPQIRGGANYSILIELATNQLILARQIAKSDDDPILIPPMEILAATYATMGDFQNSIAYYRKILKIQELQRTINPSSSTDGIIFTSNKLGMILQDRGRTYEAESYLKRALQLRAKARGSQRVSLPDLLNNLAVAYQATGRFSEAEPLLKRALALRKNENMPLKLALSFNNLAELYVTMDRLKAAEKLHLRALEIRRKIAPFGPITALSFNNLAGVYHFQKRYAEAEPYYQQALKIWLRNFGPRHPYVATVLNNMAVLYLELKRYGEAEGLNRQVLEIRQSVLGPGHPEVAATLSNIAKVYMRQGRYKQAEPFARKSLAIDEKTQKRDHPFIRKGLNRLVELYTKLDKPKLAAPLQARLNAMPPEGMKHLSVYYATNRTRQTGGREALYGPKPGGKLNFGKATVLIADTQIKRQAIRRAKAAGLLDRATGKLTAAAELKLLNVRQRQNFADIAGEAKRDMRFAGLFKDQLLVFIHGYNVSFEESLLRASQITFDLEFDGLLVPFSWPSKGELSGYQQDEKNAAGAAKDLVTLLQNLATNMPGKKIHIIAHSMGNRVLLRALEQLSNSPKRWQSVFQKLKLGEIIWAHPDVDQKEFARLTPRFARLGAKMTLYSSRDDWALWASKLLHGGNRAGSSLVLVPGIDTIDITGMKAVDRGWFEFDLNHNVFVRNPALFGELTRLLLTGLRPVHQRSPEFRAAVSQGKKYWRYTPLEAGE